MKFSPVAGVITDFFKRTTLHGFKYLISRHNFDRMVWLIVCYASACSAGVLCAVLWARFMQQPVIVAVRDLKDLSDVTSVMPRVILCPSAGHIAHQVVTHFKQVGNESWLSSALEHVILKKMAPEGHLRQIDKHLDELGMALPDALMKYSPECAEMVSTCRWQNQLLPCRRLFRKQFTDWGLCCVLNPKRLQKRKTRRLFDRLETTRRLDIALTCHNGSISYYGCELLTVYNSDEDIVPQMLHRGLSYWFQITFTATLDRDGRLLDVNGACVPNDGYSKLVCITSCLENVCGCSDPLQPAMSEQDELPQCRTTQLRCLRSTKVYKNSSCMCLPSCTKYTTDTVIETNTLDFINYTFDPLYRGLTSSASNVVHIQVRLRQSKVFYLLPTESWLTLLSSLGGVFNMFLGVGLFSALELLFFIIIKLPLALRKSAELNVQEAHCS